MVLSSDLTYVSIKTVSYLFFKITVYHLIPYPLIIREYSKHNPIGNAPCITSIDHEVSFLHTCTYAGV